MAYVDRLYGQISTAKKIQVPSDDPITAARALKFRSNVAVTTQYQRNTSQGMAWMDVTEGAYNNIVNIMKSIKDRCVEAANGTLEAVDRQAIATQIRQMVRQLGTEMNITYASRYTFSGFRTDEPPILIQDNTNGFQITQFFSIDDIEITRSYQKLSVGVGPAGTDPPLVFDTSILKLPYNSAVIMPGSGITGFDAANNPIAFNVINVMSTDEMILPGGFNPYDSANIPPGTIVHVQDTGELVMNATDAATLHPDGLTVTYEKTGFRAGELNPIVYFNCIDLSDGTAFNMDVQDIAYEFSVNTHVNVNSLAKNVYTDVMFADLNHLCNLLEGVTLSNRHQLNEKYSNPLYGHNLSGDMLVQAVNSQMADERAKLANVLYDRFNNMLYMCDRHIANISREQTDLGARMNRLELISTRLNQDEGSYKKLMSDNEDADMMESIMLKSNAEAVYQASLKAGASILQLTLSNFI